MAKSRTGLNEALLSDFDEPVEVELSVVTKQPQGSEHQEQTDDSQPQPQEVSDADGAVIICGQPCCNIRCCGCRACVRQDKTMIGFLTLIIILLVTALVVTDLAEVSALSKTGAGTENATVLARQLLALFRTMFSFLSLGCVSMIGAVRTHSPDEAEKRRADILTGKIVQVSLGVAVVAGLASTGIAFGVYESFMQTVVGKTAEQTAAAKPFLDYVAPTLTMYFVSSVLQALCLQTGHVTVVVLDAAVDLLVFVGLVLGWAKQADADDVVFRLGVCNLIAQAVKFAIYVVFCFRPSNVRRFGLLSFGASSDLKPFLGSLGWKVLWQWMQNISQAAALLAFLALVNTIGETQSLANLAILVIMGVELIPSALLGFYVTFFGSRLLGDKRYASFWGLYRFTTIWVLICTAIAYAGFWTARRIAINSVTSDATKHDVREELTSWAVGTGVAASVILGNIANYLRNVFVALHQFKVIFLIYFPSVVVAGITVAGISAKKNSFSGFVIGSVIVTNALQAIGFVAYWRLHLRPRQILEHKEILHRDGSAAPEWLKLHQALGWPDLEKSWRRRR